MRRKIQPVQVYVSSVIEAPIDTVWAVVRDFNAMPQWHPEIAESRIEEGRESSAVGCVRNFSLTNGARIRERLLELSDANYRFSYTLIESDVGLLDYVAELALFPVTDDDRTFGAWSANFHTAPGQEDEKARMVAQNVFQAGFDALKRQVGRK